MGKVSMEYEFYVLAGKGTSGFQRLADKAWEIAHEFYGDGQKFEVSVEVQGHKEEYKVRCYAKAEVEVHG